MNLEKIIELLSNNSDISIEYSNINGKEKLIVNGEELLEENKTFDDTEIKNMIKYYKDSLNSLDEWVWDIVVDEAKNKNFNLCEMDKILSLDSYTEEEAMQASNIIQIMRKLIVEVLHQEIQSLTDMIKKF